MRPSCPHCGGKSTGNGTSKGGIQRYKCVVCHKNFSEKRPPTDPIPKEELYRLPPISARYYGVVRRLSRGTTIREAIESLLDRLIDQQAPR